MNRIPVAGLRLFPGILIFWVSVYICRAQTLGEALNAPQLTWTTGGSAPWIAQTDVTHDAQLAVTSTSIPAPQTNWIETTVSGPTAIDFWWKASTYYVLSRLSFSVGGTPCIEVRGNQDWQRRSVYIPPGPQVLRWSFEQRATNSTSLNRVWVDEISFSEPVAPSILVHPTNQTVTAGDSARFEVAVAGTEPHSYAWRRQGSAQVAGTGCVLWVNNAQTAVAGNYTFYLTTPLGTALSEPATLTVTPSLPVYTQPPVSQGAAIGSAVTFMPQAKGSSPMWWHWFFEGSPVWYWTTSSRYAIDPVTALAFGNYTVVVTNSYGSLTNQVALTQSPVLTWGDSDLDQRAVSPAATNVVGLGGGDYHGLALLTNGNVVAWGFDYHHGDYYPNSEVPTTLSNVVALGAGSSHSLALQADGTLCMWGKTLAAGTSNVLTSATNVVAVALGPGAWHALALGSDGTPLVWGTDEFVVTNVPAQARHAVSVAGGSFHSLALLGDGRVVAWGRDEYGETQVPPQLTNAVAIAAGWNHDLALCADGTVVQWGRQTMGAVPANATNIIDIACRGNSCLVLRADGKVIEWRVTTPAWVTNVSMVAGMSSSSMALRAEGPPYLNTYLADRSVLAGDTAYFRALAVGAWPLAYQWHCNGEILPAQTRQVLAIPNPTALHRGTYSVVVSNHLGVAESRRAALEVRPRPAVIQPNSVVVSNGSLRFTISSQAGDAWIVQSSENLQDWTDGPTITNTTGTVDYTEPWTNSLTRYFRLRFSQ